MSQYDIYDIYDMTTSFMRPSEEQHVTEVVVHEGVIPVIFVPGVMGSNLKNTKNGGKWRVDDSWSTLDWFARPSEKRKKILTPSETVVDPEGEPPEGIARRYIDRKSGDTIPPQVLAVERGWGEVAKMSYGDFLVWLENELNIDDDGEFDTLQSRLADYYRRVSGLSTESAESRAEANVQTLGRFNFPVHACGYNWLQSNSDSAATLARRVSEIIAGYRRARMTCDKAILVTHSMGGLVARYYSEVVGGQDDLFGIVHGVMPTTGAPVFYRRMKSGTASDPFSITSWATSQVLGASAREMTAVLAQAPGPLQLVPTPEYGNGWLRIEKEGRETVALPTGDDPYTDIYLERDHWWGMMEPALAMPELEARAEDRADKLDETWTAYQNVILDKVQPFQNALSGQFNPHTYLFYSTSDEYMSYGTVTWQGRAMTYGADAVTTAKLNDQHGEHRVVTERNARGVPELYRYTISEPDEPGDGTVPERSGCTGGDQAQETLTVSTGHESAYNHESSRLFTLGAILEIAGQVP